MSQTPLAGRLRGSWVALSARERAELLETVRDQFAILGPVSVDVLGRPLDNELGIELIESCAKAPPEQWSSRHLAFATTLWLWRLSGINFTELNQGDITLAGIEEFFRAKHRGYLELLDRECPHAALDLLELAGSLAELREEIEQTHLRCFAIDGGTWERRERFVPLEALRLDDMPADYAECLRRSLGVALPSGAGHRERLAGLVAELASRGVNPARALVATAHHVLEDPAIDADYAVLTAARGVKLGAPWTLELADVLSYVALREQVDPASRGVRLSQVQIRTAIQQRMRYNVTCRARNYSPSREDRLKAQPFQFPDIAMMEDAHHGGHLASGIRLVARAPWVLGVPGGRRWRGLADLRVNRVSYREGDRYPLEIIPTLVRYSRWCQAIVEASYASGLLLDEVYCGREPVVHEGPRQELSHA